MKNPMSVGQCPTISPLASAISQPASERGPKAKAAAQTSMSIAAQAARRWPCREADGWCLGDGEYVLRISQWLFIGGGRVSKGFQCRSEHVVCTYTWYICTRANISQADTPKLHVFFCLKSLGRGMPCVTLCPPGTLVASCPTRSS